MARYRGSVCRLCRREGLKLFLKGERCYSDKCAIERRNYPPGAHGQARIKFTNYGIQLREKQKMKRMYGLLEKQFRGYFHVADMKKGVTGENLLQLLEQRLDNVVFRLGFASSRAEARQLVRHNHIRINGKKANVPSMQVKVGDVVSVNDKSRKITRVSDALEAVERRAVPAWLELNKDAFAGTVKATPARGDVTMPINEQLVVELYSK